MADQDVIHDRDATDAPGSGVGDNGHPSDNGRPESAAAAPVEATPLRDEFAARLAAAWSTNEEAVVALGLATASMQTDGRSPSYDLIHRLGECHREFLRLRLEMTRRAESLALTIPPLGAITGLGDLARLLDTVAPARPAIETVPPAPPVREPAPIAEPIPTPPELPPPAAIETAAAESTAPAPAIVPLADDVAIGPGETAPETEPVPDVENTEVVSAAASEPDEPGDEIRRAALAAIEKCLPLRVKDGTEYAPLGESQSQAARRLRERIAASASSELPAEAADLAEGRHAIANLLVLIGGVESISDSEWASIHARVTDAFGRQLAVYAALPGGGW